jgi:hypothetical protein
MERLYMKKVTTIFLVFLFIITSFSFVQGVKIQDNTIELIDQTNGGGGSCSGCEGASPMLLTDGVYIAQSFTPSHNVISKIVLYLTKSGTPPAGMKLTLFIRETLDGEDLVSMEKELDGNEDIYFLLNFDIQDINVISGNMYYMIIMTDDVGSENNGYSWFSTNENSYKRGSCWTSFNMIKWTEKEEYDMFFDTYWRDYSPNPPTIEGTNDGSAQERYYYTFSTTDPEGDDVEYYIEWGDGRRFKWIGPYESGEQVTKSHAWTYDGNYTIRVKARDIYGAESDWATMELTLPKNKVFINPFLQFFENHPYIYRLLQHLLGLH